MTTRLSVTIDLNAIASNWQLLQKKLGASCECAAVVKANAYGLGMAEVALKLVATGCRTFFVANTEEGILLRKILSAVEAAYSGITIFVLQGVPKGDEPYCYSHRLSPVLISEAMCRRWAGFVAVNAAAPKCALKLNTGMHRLGVEPHEVPTLLKDLPGFWRNNVELLLSHMACADEPLHALNPIQLNAFQNCAALVQRACPTITLSLANSSGVFLGEAFHFDLARPGAALYGLNPVPGGPSPMQPVVQLKLPVLQVRSADRLAAVGYGAQATLASPTRLAVVAGGYADGIFRSSFPLMRGHINGVKVPLVGRVSMDSLVFDVTAAGAVDEGCEIEILGEHLTADSLAQSAGTIGYEVLTALGDRLRRKYIGAVS